MVQPLKVEQKLSSTLNPLDFHPLDLVSWFLPRETNVKINKKCENKQNSVTKRFFWTDSE